ncbi:Nonribosomal peptide synthetase 12 [Neonectria ditissima]|uniref:Nonribosomal peptide synthetase 12 n=1 Tax=Neonectria ditissima TaxID=78410 RepID=A0A0P7BWP4_9HYPO|nr:Nonribosomal peptide synthetase 12 [Neonectria ditissima]
MSPKHGVCLFPTLCGDQKHSRRTIRSITSEDVARSVQEEDGARSGVELTKASWALLLHRYTGLSVVTFGVVEECSSPSCRSCGASIDVEQWEISSAPHVMVRCVQVQSRSEGYSSEQGILNTCVAVQEPCRRHGKIGVNRFVDKQKASHSPSCDLVIGTSWESGELHLSLDYATSLLGDRYAAETLSLFTHIFENQVLSKSSQTDVESLSVSNLRAISTWNAREPQKKPEQCIHTAIQERGRQTPNAPAVRSWDGSLTYKELDALAGRLQAHLQNLGIGPESVVPVYMERSMWVAISMLGILRAGGAFLLLDTSYPLARIADMCRDVKARIIISSDALGERVRHLAEVVLVPSALDLKAEPPIWPFEAKVKPENAAYLAYTSGSTGTPKGIVIEHRCFFAGALAHAKVLAMDHRSRVLHFSSYGFDISILDLLVPLALGGCVCIPSEQQRLDNLAQAMVSLGVNWAFLTPSVARRVESDTVPHLQTLVLGGEPMQPGDMETWSHKIRLMVGYGPAECTVLCTAQPVVQASSVTNIGRPYGGSAWIVSPTDNDHLQPIGAVGELVISGPAVGRGYLSRDAGKENAFLQQHPTWAMSFNLPPSERFYKTGDLVRYEGEHGSLCYLGRKDRQVKIHGQRVELQEIEHRAQELQAGITTAAEVLERPGLKESVLVLFVNVEEDLCLQHSTDLLDTAEDGHVSPALAHLQQQLRERLPRFMVPTVYIPLRYMPLTSSGKLDRKALRCLGDRYLQSQLRARSVQKGERPEDDERESDGSVEDTLRQVCARVLGLHQLRVGANDDFFALGGSSMTAIDLVAKSREAGLLLSVADVLSLQTCAKMAAVVRPASEPARDPSRFELASNSDEWLRMASSQSGIDKDSIEDMYPCTPLQAGLMSLTSMTPGLMVATYAFHLPRNIDVRRFQSAWETVVANTPILRTRIIQLDSNEMVQAVIGTKERPRWETGGSVEDVIRLLDAKEMNPGLPLTHFGLVTNGEGTSSFVLTIHHAALDGWSYLQFWDDLQTAYNAEPLPQRPSFSRFIQYISQQDSAASKEFWIREFQDLQAVPFPSRPPKWEAPEQPSLHRIKIPINPANGSKPWASIIRLSWALVVANMTHSNDVVFGNTVSGRSTPVPGIDQIAGPIIATYPLRIKLQPSMSVEDALREMIERDAGRIEFEHTGLQAIRQFSHEAAAAVDFQTLITIQPQKYWRQSPMLIELARNQEQQFKFNTHILSIIAQITPDCLILEAVFDASVLPSDTVQSIFNRFGCVIGEVCKQPNLALGSVKMITKEDQKSLHVWNQPQLESDPQRMDQLVVAAAQRNLKAEAVCAWDGTLSYGELLRLSHSVAGYLQSLHVQPDTVIAIYMERSKWLPVAVLGSLFAGSAFLLLDPKLPTQRLRDICRDADVRVALTTTKLLSQSQDVLPAQVSSVSTEELVMRKNYSWIAPSVTQSNLMYVMFTSGSTGTPKGVLIEHGMCWSTFSTYKSNLPLSNTVRMFFLAPLSFDIAVLQLLFPLAAGGCVCIPSEDECLSDLAGAITKQRANWLSTTPSVARTLTLAEVPTLATLELGGEGMLPSDVARWADNIDLWTSYGPAECAIMVTSGSVSRHPSRPVGYIGHAVNGSCWVVNPEDHHQLQPHGVIGELLVSGPSIARGYLNKPEQTTKSFIAPPRWTCDFPSAQSSRFYKTGDLVYYGSDGGLHYAGRKDDQVKHHGQRIELAEIEHCARKYDARLGVAADLVTFAEPYGTRLVLFVHEGESTTNQYCRGSQNHLPLVQYPVYPFQEELRSHISQTMPTYMVPSIIIPINHLPLSQNGKLDRRRLRTEAAQLDRETLQRLVVQPSTKRSPSTEQEVIVRGIFARVLGLEESLIGVDDCFFALGGDSITAMRLLSLCREANLALKMAQLLTHKTVAGVCQHVQTTTFQAANAMVDVPGQQFCLSPAQQMFLDHTPSLEVRFNQSFFVRANLAWSEDDWRRAVQHIMDRHSMLRSRFVRDRNGQPGQLVLPDSAGSFRLLFHHVQSREQVSVIAEQAHASVNPISGPQFSLDVLHVDGDGQFALLVAHHMVVDLVSWRVILDDIERLLSSAPSPQRQPLPFKRWIQRQIQYSQTIERPLEVLPVEVRPTDYSYWGITPEQNTFGNASRIEFVLDPSTTSILLDEANNALDTKPQEIFQAALLYSWAQVFHDRETPTVFTEGHGREPWEDEMDLSNTVGWFSTAWPCTIGDTPTATLSEVLYQVKATGRGIPKNGLPYFSARYLNPSCKQQFADHSRVEVLFNYKGQYQQLERTGAAFSQPAWTPDVGMDISPEMPRFAVFDVEVDIVNKGLHVSIWFSDMSSRKTEIARWAAQYEKALYLASEELLSQSNSLTIANIHLLGISFAEAQALGPKICDRLNLTSATLLEDIYPACRSHVGLLSGLTGHAGDHSVCEIQEIVTSRSIDPGMVTEAWRWLAKRHPILRTVLLDDLCSTLGPLHVVIKKVEPNVVVLPASSKPVQALELFPSTISSAHLPVNSLAICQGLDGRVIIRLESSHVMIDGTSISLLLRDFCDAINGQMNQNKPPVYRTYVEHVSQLPQGPVDSYWKETLSGAQPCVFPALTAPASSLEMKTAHRQIENPQIVHDFWRLHGLTLTNLCQLAWAVVLRRYTRTSDILFGTLLAGRDYPIPDIWQIVGPCINILPCRIQVEDDLVVLDVLKRNQVDMQHRADHQNCSLPQVMKNSGLDLSIPFNTCLTVQPSLSGMTPTSKDEAATLRLIKHHDPTEFELSVAVFFSSEKLEVHLRYWTPFLHVASNSRNDDMAGCVCGILFIGTPHKGSDLASFLNVLNTVVKTLFRRAPDAIVQDLSANSRHLLELDQLLRFRLGKIDIYSFYELKPMGSLKTPVVEKHSALLNLPSEIEQIGLDANHRQMCKPVDQNDFIYETIAQRILHIMNRQIHKEQFSNELMEMTKRFADRQLRQISLLARIQSQQQISGTFPELFMAGFSVTQGTGPPIEPNALVDVLKDLPPPQAKGYIKGLQRLFESSESLYKMIRFAELQREQLKSEATKLDLDTQQKADKRIADLTAENKLLKDQLGAAKLAVGASKITAQRAMLDSKITMHGGRGFYESAEIVEAHRKPPHPFQFQVNLDGYDWEEEERAGEGIYDEANHSTVPAAAEASTYATVCTVEREAILDTGGRDKISDDSFQIDLQSDDFLQKEADWHYREYTAGQRTASDEGCSPEYSVVDKWQDNGTQFFPILVPSEIGEHNKGHGEGDSNDPNADIVIENTELAHQDMEVPVFESKEPSTGLQRPIFRLTYPTPVPSRRPSPSPDEQVSTKEVKPGLSNPKIDDTTANLEGKPTSSTSDNIAWGVNQTKSCEVETSDVRYGPMNSDFAPSTYPGLSAMDVPVFEPVNQRADTMPDCFAEDLEFAATLAAGLADSGFDPNLIVDDPSYTRRESPPGMQNVMDGHNVYQVPFAEAVTDLSEYDAETGVNRPKSGSSDSTEEWSVRTRRREMAKRQPLSSAPDRDTDIPEEIHLPEPKSQAEDTEKKPKFDEEGLVQTRIMSEGILNSLRIALTHGQELFESLDNAGTGTSDEDSLKASDDESEYSNEYEGDDKLEDVQDQE